MTPRPNRRSKPAATSPAPLDREAVRIHRYRALYRMADLLYTTATAGTLYRRVVLELHQALGAQSAVLALAPRTGHLLSIEAQEGKVSSRLPDPSPLELLRLAADSVKPRLHTHNPQAALLLPIAAAGKLQAAAVLYPAATHGFTDDDLQLATALAAQAAKVLRAHASQRDLQAQSRQLEALFTVGQALISPDPLPEILNRITATVLELLQVKLCSVMLLSNRRELVLSAVSGGSNHYAQRAGAAVNDSLLGEVVLKRQPLHVFDVRKAPRSSHAGIARREKLASLLSVPIFFQEKLIGILNIYTAEPRLFSIQEQQVINAFASLCGIAIENAQRYERVLQAEEGIRQADRLATLGILSAELAHEVRNPVTIMSMLVHSLREDKAIEAARMKDMDIIADKLERINRTVTQVLNFSKRHEARLEYVNLNRILGDILFLVNHTLAARQILLKTKFDPELPDILGDKGHFDQVFLNLALNAIEAMPRGGILTVTTRLEPAGRSPARLSVVISDTGQGIPPALIPGLFQPFVTSRPQGVGLGLFVSQKLLTLYGGEIRVRSREGEGATFRVELPLEAPPRT